VLRIWVGCVMSLFGFRSIAPGEHGIVSPASSSMSSSSTIGMRIAWGVLGTGWECLSGSGEDGVMGILAGGQGAKEEKRRGKNQRRELRTSWKQAPKGKICHEQQAARAGFRVQGEKRVMGRRGRRKERPGWAGGDLRKVPPRGSHSVCLAGRHDHALASGSL
jgi:hypothetical protein